FRQLTGGSLSIGQTFLIDMDNGWIDTGYSVGWGLQNSSGQNLFEFGFTGNATNYWINDSASGFDTGIGFTGDGLRFQLTLSGLATYDLQVIRADSSTNTFSRSLAALGDQGILQLHMWNYSAGSDTERNAYWDNMAVIPEPSTVTLIALGVGCLVMRAVRRRLG
ncbi:MAG: PEP-CTERM sorting domain-containing protein, partial [Kiritimatiellae bacterium]|nr:PEP-CTERM sorting domain-containing protein [Kiritimatiellia bacterium]